MGLDATRHSRGSEEPSPTTMAEAFDADVSIATVDNALYLVAASAFAQVPPAVAVRRAGGTVAADLGEGRLLAALSFSGFSQVRSDADIGLAGPVTLDAGRFTAFMRLLGIEPDGDGV